MADTTRLWAGGRTNRRSCYQVEKKKWKHRGLSKKLQRQTNTTRVNIARLSLTRRRITASAAYWKWPRTPLSSFCWCLLLAVMVQALWQLGQMIVRHNIPYPTVLSHIVFVLILAELYRTLIFYLREHRVSVVLIVEVAIVSTVQDLMLKSAHEFEGHRVFGTALLLLVLGCLLALERYFGRFSGASDVSAH